jgi:hypothetical protein
MVIDMFAKDVGKRVFINDFSAVLSTGAESVYDMQTAH